MKSLLIAIAMCFALPLQAEVQVDKVTFYSDWPANLLLDEGESSCPGGTWPECDDANASHARGVEIWACMGDSEPYDLRVEGTGWIQINTNYDTDGTGPNWGVFKLVPGETCNPLSLINPEIYWEGSWEGVRDIVNEDPMVWVDTINIVGHGVGGYLEGQKLRAIEQVTLYTKTAIPYEFLGLTGPESTIHAEIKSKD